MRRQPVRVRLIGAVIAALAGFVDAVGFVSLGGYFVSFMSGNSTRLGVELAAGVGMGGLALVLIVAFVAGAALGVRMRTRDTRVAWGFVMIAAVLFASAALHEAHRNGAIFLTALAMGALNTVAATRASLPVGLTFMTGTLVKLGETLGSSSSERWHEAVPYALHWLALVLGAALGAAAFGAIGGVAIALPGVALLGLAGWRRPARADAQG